jgi:hypothetical protein
VTAAAAALDETSSVVSLLLGNIKGIFLLLTAAEVGEEDEEDVGVVVGVELDGDDADTDDDADDGDDGDGSSRFTNVSLKANA